MKKNLIFLSILSSGIAFSQNFKRTLKEDIYVNSNKTSIELNFTIPGEYIIYEGSSSKDINWNKSIKIDGKRITLPRNIPRPFYGIITPSKDTLIVAERKLAINDLANFRDLGGIKTTEGRHVVWGRFYRSDALNELFTSEFTYIEGLGLKKVFDLRTDNEISKAKDNLPENIIYEHFAIFSDKDGGMVKGLDQYLKNGGLTNSETEKLMLNMYKSFTKDDSDKFNNLLHQVIIQDNYPNVFHCTAGKDRTGYTAAMILAILKVDRQTILDEYEMTNFYTEKEIKEYVSNPMKLGYGNKINSEAVKTLMSVNRKFLEASFDIIDKEYGGIDAYIKNQLGFSDIEREKLIKEFTY
jgi:protein-tyrosine phosphatase